MTFAVYLPLLLPALVSWAARRAADRGRPAAAVRGLVVASAVAAAASTWSLVLIALTLLDDLPPLSVIDERPGLPRPVPGEVALVAALALVWGAVRLVRDLRRRHDTARKLRAAGTPIGDLVVADWAAPLAVAVPGRPGHLLVTSGMLRGLNAPERRAVLAHERAHLAHRHHRAVAWAAAAAAVNPLLVPTREVVSYLVERWADEDAASAVEDRGLVARAVARAALAAADTSSPVLGMHGGVIVRRVRALGRPAPAADGGNPAIALAAALGGLVAVGAAALAFVEVARIWLHHAP